MTAYQVADKTNLGTVVSVRGSIIDVQFPKPIPEIYNQLKAGENGKIIIEVVTHINA